MSLLPPSNTYNLFRGGNLFCSERREAFCMVHYQVGGQWVLNAFHSGCNTRPPMVALMNILSPPWKNLAVPVSICVSEYKHLNINPHPRSRFKLDWPWSRTVWVLYYADCVLHGNSVRWASIARYFVLCFFPPNLFLKSHLPGSDRGRRQNERAEINVIARDFKANYVRPCSACRAELVNPDSCPVLPRYFPVSHLVPITPYKTSREMLLCLFNRLRIWDDRDANFLL